MLQNIEAQSAAFRSIIANMNKTYEGVDPFFKQIEHLNTQLTYIIVGQLAKHLAYNNQPINRVNALAAACRLLEIANYPTLLLAEIYLVPCLQNAVEYVVAKPDFKYFTAFFQEEGYNHSIPHLQNLSYNFLTLTCQFIQLGSSVKPLRVYEGKEYSQASLFKRQQERLGKSGYQVEPMSFNMKVKEGSHLRQKYINSLSRWDQVQEQMLVFYIRMLDFYLSEGTEPKGYHLNFIDTLKYGETSITSEIIARLIDVIAHGQDFKIRSRALKLFDSFILWGDVEALLVANYAEHIQLIIQAIWKVEGSRGLEAGRNIYSDIPGQEEQKYDFYVHFLRCLQTWSECYPTKQFFSDNLMQANEHSTLYQLYRLLKEKKRFIFPQNLGISKYQRESHRNIREKLIRNQMILNDINGKTEVSNIQEIKKKTLKEVQEYYQVHKEYLLQILHKGQDYLYENMKKLLEFKENFQNYVETIDAEDQSDEAIDTLIQNGLELIDLITAINNPYIEFLKQDYNYPQFKEAVTGICYQYFNPKKNQNKLRQILSQKVKVKKQQLKSMIKYQRSIPLWNELQAIFSNINLRELRSKYQQKKNKSHNSKHSQSQSSINLQIYTKTKFTKESRQQRLKVKHESRHSIDASLQQMNNDSLLIKNNSTDQLSEIKKPKDHPKDQKNLTGRLDSNKARQNKKKIIVCSIPKMKSPLKNNNIPKQQPSNIQKARNNIASRVKQANSLTNSRPESIAAIQSNQPKWDRSIIKQNTSDTNQYYSIPFEENKQYFTDLDDQRYKFSYVYAHIVIFRSSYLTIERAVTQIPEGNKIKVNVQIMLLPYQPLYKFQYGFDNQECIELEDRSAQLPEMMTPNGRYCLRIVGTMKKIPLKLPRIIMSVNSYPIFQYILPFTINFFLPSCFSKIQTILSYSQLIKKPYICYSSASFKYSETLFNRRDTSSIMVYFPYSLRLEEEGEKYLWQVKDQACVFLVLFQFQVLKGQLMVKIFSAISDDNSYHELFRFILNCLAHILAG